MRLNTPTPWEIVYCDLPAQECRTFWREEGTRLNQLPEVPGMAGVIPEDVDHVHIQLRVTRDVVLDHQWCDNCEQDIVITGTGKFAKHRHAPSTVPNSRIKRLGDWCKNSGVTA